MNLMQRLSAAWHVFKSLNDLHPELSDREHLARIRSDEVFTPSSYSYLNAVADYGAYVWVRKAVLIIANNFSALPVMVTRDGEQIEHPVQALLTGVNDTLSSADLWQQWTIDMLLGGEEGWELVRSNGGQYLEIWPRQPHTIAIVPDAAKRRYFRVAEYKVDDGAGDPYRLPPEEFIHFKFYSPANPWRGISPISAVRSSIVIDTLAQAWSKLFLKRGARPDYAVVAPQGTTRTEREQLISEIEAMYGGAANAHKPIALEQGIVDIKPLSFPPKDIEWVEQRKLSRAEVAAIFGVPDEIMGYGRDTYENFDTALRVLWTLTIQPLARLRDTHLTEWFRRYKLLTDKEAVATDYSGVSILKEDYGAKLDQAVKLFNMGVPFNRVDELVGLGVGKVPGGDTGFLPLGLAPVTALGMDQGWSDPEPEQLSARPRVKMIATKGAPDYGSEEHKQLWNEYIKRASPHERRLGAAVRGLLNDQEHDVLGRVREDAGSAASSPFDQDQWRKTFKEKTGPIIKRTVKDSGEQAADDLDVGYSFNVDDPNVVKFLQAREQRFARRVNDTTWQALKDSLTEGVEAGESIAELEKRVEAVMDLRKGQSSETIARTEVIGATNGGTLLSWKQSERVGNKTWIATFDDRVRDSHADAHGQTVGLDDDFQVGNGSGPAPGQIGVPEEDINCRCTMIAVLKQD